MVILPYELTKTLIFNVYNPLPIRLIADYYSTLGMSIVYRVKVPSKP
mgnify:CR=1